MKLMKDKIFTCSIVVYENDEEKLRQAIQSFLEITLFSKLYIIDNSPTDFLQKICISPKIEYVHSKKNLGFGKAHNIILRKIKDSDGVHLIMNPDIFFNQGVVEELYKYIVSDKSIGLVMPKVLNVDGSIQYNCKLLPKPYNLIVRRFFGFFTSLVDKSNDKYEMRFTDYNHIMEVPYLSGCFMLVKNEVLRNVGLFDERFFLYAEDIDFSRRIHQKYKTMYYPKVEIYHYHEKGSYKDLKLLYYNIQSAFRYFNKWGWWGDKERTEVNQKTMIENRSFKIFKKYQEG
jgi:GT2 family glycosyltransferase